ncbi:AAA family ATPase [Phaeobacter sp. JH85H1]|uniref:AAA family ATPase n=1 Tax=unclassified Phaeobacter TaxID=2621772 RepID=UPI003A86DC94
MLRKLKINRFKSIRSENLDFGRVNLFIGGNGSGKSNILEAIGVASASLHRGLSETAFSEKGIRLTPSELMKSAHKNVEIPSTLELDCEFECDVRYKCNLTSREGDLNLRFHSESCEFSGGKAFGRSGNGQTVFGNSTYSKLDASRGMWDQVKVAYDFPDEVRQELDRFATYAIFTPQADVLRGVIGGDAISEGPIGLHGEGLPAAVLTLLRNYATPQFEFPESKEKQKLLKYLSGQAADLAFLPGWTNKVRVGQLDEKLAPRRVAHASNEMVYFIDRYMKEGRNTLSAYDSSEGTLFLLFVAVLLAHPDAPKHFGLDNIDNALNPRLTRELIESIIEITEEYQDFEVGPKQIFMTSHNPTSLDAFDLFDENLRVFVVARDDRGYTKATRLKPADGMSREEWDEAKGGRNLSQLWLDDLIDGANGYSEI